jgi:hypothetical protein
MYPEFICITIYLMKRAKMEANLCKILTGKKDGIVMIAAVPRTVAICRLTAGAQGLSSFDSIFAVCDFNAVGAGAVSAQNSFCRSVPCSTFELRQVAS